MCDIGNWSAESKKNKQWYEIYHIHTCNRMFIESDLFERERERIGPNIYVDENFKTSLKSMARVILWYDFLVKITMYIFSCI